MTIFDLISRTAAAATVTLIAIAPVHAETATIDILPAHSVVVKTAAGHGSARFDWMRPTTPVVAERVAYVTPPGNGSWICSPSGFGSKSKCYRR
ncbi:hypothetical protein [Paenirhodobacter hankyongi]|uniref:Uncharacterized protein n=1 Tax=Paenirhodobacter hankyongi TaxID=2294033 RepID=A0A421BN95_9RHOB|nr:hypothetical protein [Sinirhodobacter hankyongi]RLL64245.1 hypothetical protein DYS74_11925 [Sinirhodobacter hankyongi]